MPKTSKRMCKMSRFFVILCLLILLIVICIVCVLNTNSDDEATLQLVHVVFRHGSRTPDARMSYPNDPYINHTYFPYGHGQLTNEGKNIMYLLGKSLRKRYDKFLGPIYTPNLVDPVSTEWNRTKMSLELVLAGLFPPHETDMEWQKELNWQPIPYNYLSVKANNFFLAPLLFCPKYISTLRSLESTQAGIEFHKRQSELYQYLKDQSSMASTSFLRLLIIYGTLVAQEAYGLALPSWTKAIYPKLLEEYLKDFFVFSTSTVKLKQLSSGIFLKKLIDDTLAKVDNKLKPSDRKLFLYSAHDVHIVYVLSAMNVYFPNQPPYGAYVLIEIHKIKGVSGIKIYYQDYTAKEPRVLKVPGCDYFCPLEHFLKLIDENLPTDVDQCKDDSSILKFEEFQLVP